MSYNYGVLVESIRIVDAALACDNDPFQALRVSEEETKCNQNNIMSLCLAIIIDQGDMKRIFDRLKVVFDQVYIVSVTS